MGGKVKKEAKRFEDKVKGTAKSIGGTFLGPAGMIGGTTRVAGKAMSAAGVSNPLKPPSIPDIEVNMPGGEKITEPATIDYSGAIAAEEERRRRANSRGRGSTILTGSLGSTESANIGTSRLLG